MTFSFALLTLANVSVKAATYYVATNGSDSASGTLSAPFATLEKARSVMVSGDTTQVRGGTYLRTSTFTLTSANSGTKYQNYPGEAPILIGGLPLTNWQTWQTNILAVNASTQGVSGVFRTLLFKGERQILARVPNFVPADPHGFTNGHGFAYVATGGSGTFTYSTGDFPKLSTWASPALAQVFRFYDKNYGNRINPVTSVNSSTRTINITSPDRQPVAGDRYYVQNVFEELDTTNEFYFNPSTHIVYWFAPTPPGDVPAYAIVTTNLISIGKGALNIWVSGFTLDGACSSAVVMTSTTNCMVTACTVRNVGDYFAPEPSGEGAGVWVNGGLNNGVATNTIYSIGADGVLCSGGNSTTLTYGSNYAAYNTITMVGLVNKEVGGVHLLGCGNRASHNLIFECPRWGVGAGGWMGLSASVTAHTIEYNHIYNVTLETDDTAPIYFYAEPDWISYRESVVRFNYIHDCAGYGAGYNNNTPNSGTRNFPTTMCQGIYLDALGNGVDIYGNIIDKIAYGNVYINGGRDNLVHNNILLQSTNWETMYYCYSTNSSEWAAVKPGMVNGYNSVQGQAVWASVPGMNVAPTNTFPNGLTAGGNLFTNNIVLYHPYQHGLYNFIYGDSAGPYYTLSNRWDFNCVYDYGTAFSTLTELPATYVSWSAWQSSAQDGHSIIADAQFRLSHPGDYYVQNAAVLALGFQQIPASHIGPTNLFPMLSPATDLHVVKY